MPAEITPYNRCCNPVLVFSRALVMRNVVVKGCTAFLAALFDNVMPTDHPEIFLMPWQDRFELLHSFFLGFFFSDFSIYNAVFCFFS